MIAARVLQRELDGSQSLRYLSKSATSQDSKISQCLSTLRNEIDRSPCFTFHLHSNRSGCSLADGHASPSWAFSSPRHSIHLLILSIGIQGHT